MREIFKFYDFIRISFNEIRLNNFIVNLIHTRKNFLNFSSLIIENILDNNLKNSFEMTS